jgi:hypothetical protein
MKTLLIERRARRVMALSGWGIAAVLLLGASTAVARGPRILVPQDVPNEVTALVESAWASYLDAFPAKHDCIGTVELVLVANVPAGEASYRYADHLVRIEIPTTPEDFPESLAHELGHHLDRACGAREEIGARLVVTQGLDRAASWDQGVLWHEIPAEHFAEAVVEVALGRRLMHADIVTLSELTLRLVSDWGNGKH